jgi:hypothetical protein
MSRAITQKKRRAGVQPAAQREVRWGVTNASDRCVKHRLARAWAGGYELAWPKHSQLEQCCYRGTRRHGSRAKWQEHSGDADSADYNPADVTAMLVGLAGILLPLVLLAVSLSIATFLLRRLLSGRVALRCRVIV